MKYFLFILPFFFCTTLFAQTYDELIELSFNYIEENNFAEERLLTRLGKVEHARAQAALRRALARLKAVRKLMR